METPNLRIREGGTVLDSAYEDLQVRFATRYTWCYERLKERLTKLYEKGKQEQWNASTDLDWSLELDPERPLTPEEELQVAIHGSPVWERLNDRERRLVAHHSAAWVNSQFLHGEQGALLVSSKLVDTVPYLESKLFGASQVMDEARHVEVYHRYLTEKMDLAYPVTAGLKELLDRILTEDRWDMNFLGMQILVEGLALAAFGTIYQVTSEPLMKSLVKFVMADEARHVAFGVISLVDILNEMSDAERREREDFALDACALMRDRLTSTDVWERLGLPVEECREWVEHHPSQQLFRRMLFTRLMPNLKKLGLVNERTTPKYAELGVLEYADAAPPSDEGWSEGVVRPQDYRPEGA